MKIEVKEKPCGANKRWFEMGPCVKEEDGEVKSEQRPFKKWKSEEPQRECSPSGGDQEFPPVTSVAKDANADFLNSAEEGNDDDAQFVPSTERHSPVLLIMDPARNAGNSSSPGLGDARAGAHSVTCPVCDKTLG